MRNDQRKSAYVDDIKLPYHIMGNFFEYIHGVKRHVLGQVFLHRKVETVNVDALELPCRG